MSHVHVGDLDGSSAGGGPNWTATVTITVHDAGQNVVPVNTTVDVTWPAGFAGNASCNTDGAGQCEVTSGPIPNRNKTVTLTVTGIPGTDYDQAENHDPDGDSDGTTITVNK